MKDMKEKGFDFDDYQYKPIVPGSIPPFCLYPNPAPFFDCPPPPCEYIDIDTENDYDPYEDYYSDDEDEFLPLSE
jgi:hypothetical protein